MIDIQKQIAYWRDGALEDWEFAKSLIEQKKIRYGLFFTHLALEKILKALVVKTMEQIPPKIHNLLHLGKLTNLQLSLTQRKLFARMNEFQIEGLYPDTLSTPPTLSEAQQLMLEIEEVFKWLMNQ